LAPAGKNRPGLTSLYLGGAALKLGQADMNLNRNTITLIVAVLAVATAVLGYQLYQERQKPKGVEISIGGGGISIGKK